MAIKANSYMAVVDSWRPQTQQFKEAYDDYKRWAGAPAGTEWTGRTANAAYERAATDCHGSDNSDGTAEDAVTLATATITYEVVPNLTGGQNLVERVLAQKDRVSIDQSFNMDYHPAEGESDESVARNREHVKESERLIKEYVAKWEKGCQTLKGQADTAAQKITGCINPKTALVDGRKILRDATAPKPGEGPATVTATSVNYKELYPKKTDPAGTSPAAAGGNESIDYKKLYPKTTVDGHQVGSLGAIPGVREGDPTKPAKLAPTLADRDVPAFKAITRQDLINKNVPADQIEQRVNDAVKAAQAPRFQPDVEQMRTPGEVPLHNSPGDKFNSFITNANEGGTDTAKAMVQEGKILTGQAGPGAPGVAEAWKEFGANAAKSAFEATTNQVGVAKDQVEQFADNPGRYVGGKLVEGAAAGATLPFGGEGAAGTRGLVGDLAHGVDDVTPGHHPTPGADHHTPAGGHDSSSHPTGHLPPDGEPGSFGYDADGNRLRYANGRPDYGPGQIPEVWNTSREDQLSRIGAGKLDLPEPGPGQQWVELHPRGPVDEGWTVDNGHRLIDWQPGEPQKGLWDMGHVGGGEYRTLREAYLSGQITFEEYMAEYRNPDNYTVQDWYRNRSHIDEGP